MQGSKDYTEECLLFFFVELIKPFSLYRIYDVHIGHFAGKDHW